MIKRIFNSLKYPFIGPARLGRVRYINLCALLSVFTLLLLISAMSPALTILITQNDKYMFLIAISVLLFVLFILIFFIRLNSARLHDFNCSGWWSILATIPLINLIFYSVLFIKSGKKGENKFGKQPESPSLAEKIIVIFSIIIIWTINGGLFFLSGISQLKQ